MGLSSSQKCNTKLTNMAANRNHIKVFVSSTVYNFEDTLTDVFALLDGKGYDVYMSKEGTIPLNSRLNTFVNCTKGVEECDVFVGFIRPLIGTGIPKKGVSSVTELEFHKAFEKGMVRFVLADYKVEFAHQYFNLLNENLSRIPDYKDKEVILPNGNKVIERHPNKIVHRQCVELYRMAIQNDEKDFEKRKGNWVQAFKDKDDIIRHLEAQFNDVERIKKLLP